MVPKTLHAKETVERGGRVVFNREKTFIAYLYKEACISTKNDYINPPKFNS